MRPTRPQHRRPPPARPAARPAPCPLALLPASIIACAAACAPEAPEAHPPPGPARTTVRVAVDDALAGAARKLERAYELERPGVDIALAQRAPDAAPDADLLFADDPADAALPPAEPRDRDRARVHLHRRVGVLAPADSRLRLIDLSRGTCDVIIAPAGTPLGDMSRDTLRQRGLDDQINPRLVEADPDDVIDRLVARNAIGLGFIARAADRPGDVRILAAGAGDDAAIGALSPEGEDFLRWLTADAMGRRTLRSAGYDVSPEPTLTTPQRPP